MNPIQWHVPCHGATHRLLWQPGKAIVLLDHDPRLYRVEKHLAAASGDLDIARLANGPPPAGCMAALVALQHVFRGGAPPTWLQNSGTYEIIEYVARLNTARSKRLHELAEAIVAMWPAQYARVEWQHRKNDAFARIRHPGIVGLFGRDVQ